jgi:hypothetical protein
MDSVLRIPASSVRSLVWHGDDLVDWVDGGVRFRMDGTRLDSHVRFGDRFDSAVTSPSGEYAVIYERLGTKGLVLKNGKIVREINRSYYQAEAYEYPVHLFRLPGGDEVIAHCPDEYNRIDIDLLETGRRLTSRTPVNPADFFHSRLSTSSDGRWLVSAGWVWHPFSGIALYDLSRALDNPSLLDVATGPKHDAEVGSAAFWGKDHLFINSPADAEGYSDDEDEVDPTLTLVRGYIGQYALPHQRYVRLRQTEAEVGTMMPVHHEYVVGFYDYPKLFHVPTGRVVKSWPDLSAGKQTMSIIWGIDPVPPIAMDPPNRRFAVADSEKITVVTIDETSIQ